MLDTEEVSFTSGGLWEDERGSLRFVNSFAFNGVKRFYQIEQKDTSIVRAWQGHRVEHKYFYAAKGSFLIGTVKIDNWESPSLQLNSTTFFLKDDKPGILSIPPGYANGIKALYPNSILMVYSNLSLKQSEQDRYVYSSELWLDWSHF